MIRLFHSTVLTILIILAPMAATAQSRADPEAESGWTQKPLVTAERHMIVAAHPSASTAGREMLRAGGSAADAAIAALLVLNVVEPQSSGIGGGAFALVHGPNGTTSFDARETAPLSATPELFFVDGKKLGWTEAVPTGRSIGTPGLVALMHDLHQRHGVLPWADLFRPAIALAEKGFPVSPRLAESVASFSDKLIGTDAAALFLPNGDPIVAGATLRNPDLARSLRRIALSGPSVFYNGQIADQIVASVAREPIGGGLVRADLSAYRVIERPPVCMTYRAYDICGMGPPSSGATTVGQILGLIEATGDMPTGADGAHLFAEASRLAYADRGQYLADPDQVNVPVRGLLDPGYLMDRAKLISMEGASPGPAEPGDPPWREGQYAPDQTVTSPGTTHLSVIDGSGLAISLTASIETAFGSKRMAGGFLLNNQLTDFSFAPTGEDGLPIANAPDAGKRPRSSMAPTIVFEDDALILLVGSPGGSRIPEYVAGSLISALDFGLDVSASAAGWHVSHGNRGGVMLEAGGPGVALVEGLVARGHDVDFSVMTSGLHIIGVFGGSILGGADPRREGVSLGD